MAEPFHLRFDINVPIEEARRRFINRIANRVRIIASALSFDETLDGLMWDIEGALGESHSWRIEAGRDGEPIFVRRWCKIVADDFLRCLHAVEGFYKGMPAGAGFLGDYDPVRALNDAVGETLAESEVDIGVSWQDGYFIRKGAKILDDKLINESLRWLADPKYQNVLGPFEKGLSHFLEGTKDPQRYGDAVTDAYESLEAMAKIVTGKARDLSSLRDEFVAKLSLPSGYRSMLKEYIEYGCEFRHAVEKGQRRSWPLEHEAEAFIYQSGLFLRLAIQSEKFGS